MPMSNIAMQIERLTAGSVATGANVVFDNIVYEQGSILYDPVSGMMTFAVPGRYIVTWSVSIQSTMSATGVSFTLTATQGGTFESQTVNRQGQITGTAIINVETAPVAVFLVNSTDNSCYYSLNTDVTANMVVFQNDIPVSVRCFAVMQMTHFLQQMVVAYPTTTWTVFSQSLASYSGVPVDVYAAPGMDEPGILRLVDTSGGYEALPIQNITAVYPGAGTLYDPTFTFLPEPDPLPQDCDAFALKSIQTYLPVGTQNVNIRLGPSVNASGDIYKNELGIVILSDAMGNTPIAIASPLILRMYTTSDPVNTRRSLPARAPSSPNTHTL